jgi:TonB family protein
MRSLVLVIFSFVVCTSAFADDLRVSYAPAVKIPDEARVKHLKGVGLFKAHLYRDGSVRQVEMVRSTGHAILDKAAMDAIAKWKFTGKWVWKVLVPMNFDGNYPPDKFR